jgi:hypothetical protein
MTFERRGNLTDVVTASTWRETLRLRVIDELVACGLDAAIGHLRALLPGATPIFLVGGFVRDCARMLLEGEVGIPKDADIVVDTDRLSSAIHHLDGSVSRTALGGYRWQPPGGSLSIDTWQLADTVWIQELGLPRDIESFLDGVDLNVDRVAIGLHDQSVFDRGCSDAIRSRTIDLDGKYRLSGLECDELARAIVAHLKTGYRLSRTVQEGLQRVNFDNLMARAAERLRIDGYSEEIVDRVLRVIRERRGVLSMSPHTR